MNFKIYLICFLLIQLNTHIQHHNYKSSNSNGESLFNKHCASCHSLDHKLIGPPLRNILLYRDSLWLRDFIMNGMQMVKSNDSLAIQIFLKYNRITHPDFSVKLNNKKIEKIIAYCNQDLS